MVEVMNKMVTSFKISHAHTTTLSAPNPAQGPWKPMPLPKIPGHSHASRGQSLVGSLLLSPGSWCAQGFVCALQVLFPQAHVCSGGSMMGLMVTSSKRAYATPSSAAPRAPAPAAVHCRPTPPQETLKHRCLSPCGVSVLVCTRYVWALCMSLVGMGFDSKGDFTPPTVLLGFWPWAWGISSKIFFNILEQLCAYKNC